MARGAPDGKKDDLFSIVLLAFALPTIFIALAWLMGSHKIVVNTVPLLYQIGKVWRWLPSGDEQLMALAQSGQHFLNSPKDTGFLAWLAYVNRALMPLSWFVSAGMLGLSVWTWRTGRRRHFVQQYSPASLMSQLSKEFTGIIPIMHLRKQIAQGKLAAWRRQTFPIEFLQRAKSPEGKPVIVDGEVQPDVLERCLIGIDPRRAPGGRPYSHTLGRLVVDLPRDRAQINQICFPDRLSDVGKVLFALLAAHAFGEREGIADYRRACDELNRSCAGAPNGVANLTVAQWLYDKYRMNTKARALFAVHHWEYSFLTELLRQAKRQGKCGHTSFMWLKPMNRVLFYALNQVGRWVPHAESAAVFDHHHAEQIAARSGRVLCMRDPQSGEWRHIIWTRCAIEGFLSAHQEWAEGVDDEEDWWTDPTVWQRLSSMAFDSAAPAPEGEAAQQVLAARGFDSDMAQARATAQTKADADDRAALSQLFS